MTVRVLSIPDVSCDHCKHAIEQAVLPLMGVESVDVDVARKAASVTGGDLDAVVAAIEEAGYDVASVA